MTDNSPQQQAALAAAGAWKLTRDFRVADGVVRCCEAEAGTGSRYLVVVTWLPAAEPGDWYPSQRVVSVLHPWDRAYMFGAPGPYLHVNYVAEKLCPPNRALHWGDLAALTLTAAAALGMSADPLADLGVGATGEPS